MFPNDIAILVAIEEAEELTIKQLTYVTDVRGVALRYLCNSLVRRGHLEQNDPRGYRITFRGKRVLLKTPHETKLVSGKYRDLITWLSSKLMVLTI